MKKALFIILALFGVLVMSPVVNAEVTGTNDVLEVTAPEVESNDEDTSKTFDDAVVSYPPNYFDHVIDDTESSANPAYDYTYEFFWGNGCPHCAKVEKFFDEEGIYEDFTIESYEIYNDKANADILLNKMEELGYDISRIGVPTMIFNGEALVGDGPIIEYFEGIMAGDDTSHASAATTSKDSGSRTLDDNFIWLLIGAAIVDAVNPCAFAVLIILLSTVLAHHNRKRALVTGLAFAFAIFLSYILMGLSVYKAISVSGLNLGFILFLGVFAIVLGLFNLKDFLWYGRWFKMEVPMRWRPKMKSLIQSVTSPWSAFLIGILVSLFLLPCTSGPYIVILGMLGTGSYDAVAIGYLILYNLIFILPMVAITLAVFFGLSVSKTEEVRKKNMHRLHLIEGVILLGMGIWILLTYL